MELVFFLAEIEIIILFQGANAQTQEEAIAKFEVMDGCPNKGILFFDTKIC